VAQFKQIIHQNKNDCCSLPEFLQKKPGSAVSVPLEAEQALTQGEPLHERTTRVYF